MIMNRPDAVDTVAKAQADLADLKSAQLSGDSSFVIYNNFTDNQYDVSANVTSSRPYSAFFQFDHEPYYGGNPVVGAEPFYNAQFACYIDSLSTPANLSNSNYPIAKVTNSPVNNGPNRLYFQLYFQILSSTHTYYFKFYVQSIFPGTFSLMSIGPA